MTTEPLYHGLKFLYVRDPLCPDHVLTIARKRSDDGKSLIATFCVNKAVLSDIAYRQDHYKPKWIPLDRFNKKNARHICVERFERNIKVFTVPLKDENELAVEALLDFFTHGGMRGYEYNQMSEQQKLDYEPLLGETPMSIAARALLKYETRGKSEVIPKRAPHNYGGGDVRSHSDPAFLHDSSGK